MQEKRIYRRFRENLNIKYDVLSAPEIENIKLHYGETELLDISQGGILFTNSVPIPISSFLEIEIIVPEHNLPINLTGKVVRVEEIIPDEKYEIGFFFKHIFEKDSELLLKYLKDVKDKT